MIQVVKIIGMSEAQRIAVIVYAATAALLHGSHTIAAAKAWTHFGVRSKMVVALGAERQSDPNASEQARACTCAQKSVRREDAAPPR